MDQAAQKGAGGDDDRAGRELAAVHQTNASDSAVSNDQVVRLAFDDLQIRGLANRSLHRGGIELAVGLGTRTTDRRTLAAIEHPELDAGGIGDAAHQTVQRIDLADQMALAESADRGIAGHGADGRKTMGHQGGARAHARGCGRGLAAGVAASDHDDVE